MTELMTLEQVSERTHYSVRSLQRWIAEGRLRVVRFGKRPLVTDRELEAFIQAPGDGGEAEESMRLGIVGSRTFTDWRLVRDIVYQHCDLTGLTIVSGGAVGADLIGAEFARERGIPLIEYLPDKERYGWPAAAFERNSLIVADSDEIMAFFGPGEPPSVNKSGTMDTVRKAIAKRIPVHLYFQSDGS